MPAVRVYIHFQTAYGVKSQQRLLLELYLLASARDAGSRACAWPPELHACRPDVLTLTRMLGYGSDSEEIRLSYSSLERSSCVFNMKHFIR